MKRNELLNKIENVKVRSAWSKGVKEYALMIIENADYIEDITNAKDLLNGAENWKRYSEGGCALAYDGDIAKVLCTPSMLRKTDNGNKEPNRRERWIDVQTHALYQAAYLINSILFRAE